MRGATTTVITATGMVAKPTSAGSARERPGGTAGATATATITTAAASAPAATTETTVRATVRHRHGRRPQLAGRLRCLSLFGPARLALGAPDDATPEGLPLRRRCRHRVADLAPDW